VRGGWLRREIRGGGGGGEWVEYKKGSGLKDGVKAGRKGDRVRGRSREWRGGRQGLLSMG